MSQTNAERQKAYRDRQRNAAEADRNAERVRTALEAAGERWEPRDGQHCETCGYPAGRWTPPLDDRTGLRMLASDPRGWHPDHGPDVGLPCCRQYVCYDARPGHRTWLPSGDAA